MKLFKYEMKKLLLNKPRVILLALLFGLYFALGFFVSLGGEGTKEPTAEMIKEAEELKKEYSGKFSQEQYEKSIVICEATVAEHGKGDELQRAINSNPVLKFHFQYKSLGERVYLYWNGPAEQNENNIIGVYPLEKKISKLESSGKAESYKYRYYKNRLNSENNLGEPVYADIPYWNNFFIAFDGMFVIMLLFMVISFFISPLFTQEVKTDMDSIILCSLKGRLEIVSAKLFAAAATSVIIAAVYILGFSAGLFVGVRDLGGLSAPARCIEVMQYSMLDMTVGGIVALSALWLIFVSLAFGMTLAFVSTRVKNHSTAFGLGIVILIGGVFAGYIRGAAEAILWPLKDFHFGALAVVNTIIGGTKAYNFFGQPLPYLAAAFLVGLAIIAAASLLTYLAQRRRTVV